MAHLVDKDFWMFSSQAILVLILALYAEVRAIGQRWEKTSTYVKIIYTLLVISSALLSALGLLGALVYFSGEGHWEAYAWSARTAVAFLISTVLIYPVLDPIARIFLTVGIYVEFIDPRGRFVRWKMHRRLRRMGRLLAEQEQFMQSIIRRRNDSLLIINNWILRALHSRNVRPDPSFDKWVEEKIRGAPSWSEYSPVKSQEPVSALREIRDRFAHATDSLEHDLRDLRERLAIIIFSEIEEREAWADRRRDERDRRRKRLSEVDLWPMGVSPWSASSHLDKSISQNASLRVPPDS